MQKGKEMVLTSSDLQAVGINSQLTSNDLVEVVAHEIFDKYIDAINDVVDKGKGISKAYHALLNPEIAKMKSILSKHFKGTTSIEQVDEDDIDNEDFEGLASSFTNVGDSYWSRYSHPTIQLKEKDKGTYAEQSYNSFNFPPEKEKTVKIKLTLSSGNKSFEEQIKVGVISGTVETNIKKVFTQVVTIPTTRFKDFKKIMDTYTTDVNDLAKSLPKNGSLSVERFTREARVKMNKKIISAQSPDFKDKMAELFGIKL